MRAFSGKRNRSKPSDRTSNSPRSAATVLKALRSQHSGNRKRSLGFIRQRCGGASAKHSKSRPPDERSDEGDAEEDDEREADRRPEQEAAQGAPGGLGLGHVT